MAEIFVSYRRGDSAGHTGRLVDHLERHFGRPAVFQDVQSIEAGRRWDQVIADGVKGCRVLVAVIGRDWLSAGADGRRRIDDPQDHLRREVAGALERGVPVIPVLVEGARMPTVDELPENLKPLARWQAHELSDPRWEYDTGRLMGFLERAAALAPARPSSSSGKTSNETRKVVALTIGATVVVALAGAWWFLPPSITPPVAGSPANVVDASTGKEAVPPPVIAPARFAGEWYDESATNWGIRQLNEKIEINHTASGSGTAIGYAEGKASDRTINFEYVQMVPDEPRLRGELVLSDDGKRLTGVLSDPKAGGNTRIVLHRRSP